ncbi:hypothetical protein KDL45_15745, partial [bacterium]|nr:hypothetical protein [bacterium]
MLRLRALASASWFVILTALVMTTALAACGPEDHAKATEVATSGSSHGTPAPASADDDDDATEGEF